MLNREALQEELMAHHEAVEAKITELQEHLDKKFAAVHRNIHSGDKVSKVLMALVETIVELDGEYIWACPECGDEGVWNAENAADGGTPMCCECDIDMEPARLALFGTEAWKDAESIVLRIKRAKENK